MVKYHPVQVHLSSAQKKRLLNGYIVSLKHTHIGKGNTKVHVTGMQHKRMLTAVRNSKGMRLGMSRPQLNHNLKHGSGIFDVIKKGIAYGKNLLKNDAVRSTVKNLGQQAVNTAFNVARGYAGKYNNPLINSGLNYANTYANNQLGQQIDKAGSGFRGGF